MKKYKFLDVGCKIGGSFYISKKFNYQPHEGLGIDINENHVNNFNSKGFDAIVGDGTDIKFDDDYFELVILSHVIEHMANEEKGKKLFEECLRVTSKFLFLALPFFDEDEYINSLGFKTYYSDWTGHTNKIHLSKILKEYIGNRKHEIKMIKKLSDSSASEIIPISAPIDSFDYNESLHGSKEIVNFDRDIWREYTIVIQK